MKILVTGSKGMLGTDVVGTLAAWHDVTGMDVGEVDITERDALSERVRGLGPDVIVNAAALTDVDGCETRSEEAFQVNAQGVENLALVCRDRGVRLLHVSTDYVFDGAKKEPYREEDRRNPLSVYGRSKREGEDRAMRILPDVCIVRTAWLYGRAGRNFVQAILEKAQKDPVLNVVDDQWGSPTFTKDLARAIKAAVEMNLSGVYHVTNQGACSWFHFARRILEIAGRTDVRVLPISSKVLGRPAPRPENSVLDCRRFETATGVRLRTWEDALADYMNQ